MIDHTIGTRHAGAAAGLRKARLASAIALGLICFAPLALHAQPAGFAQAHDQAVAQSSQGTPSSDQSQNDDKSKKTDEGNDTNSTQLSTVVVTGLRVSLMSAQQRKRNADQIIESVTALDIGALPDRSVTDTLSRMSGVTVDRFAAPGDPDHPSAEGSGIQIRGMTQVKSMLNGGDVFSAASGRGLSWQDVPSELMAGVDIYLDPNASIPEGGIGGTVNLRTRLPFDQKGRMVAFNAGINYGDLAQEHKPSASFLYSNRWHSDSMGEFGVLFDVAYSSLASRSDGVQVEPFLRRTDPALLAGTDFTQVFVPSGVDWRQLNFERERVGMDIALQWRPSDNFQMSTQALRSSYSMSWVEHAAFYNDTAQSLNGSVIGSTNNGIFPASGTQFQYDDNGVFQSGYLTSSSWRGAVGGQGVRFQTDTRTNKKFEVTTDWSTKFKWNISSSTVLKGGVQFVKSTSRSHDFTVFDALYLPDFYIDVTNPASPVVSYSPSDFADQKVNYFWSAAMDHNSDAWAMERAYHLDLQHYFSDSSWARSVSFGLRTTNMNEVDHSSPYNWGVLSDNWATLADTPTGTGLADMQNYLPDMADYYTFPHFFRGNINVPAMYAPAVSLSANPQAAYEDYLNEVQPSWGWKPYQGYEPGDINNQKQETYAAYGMLSFGSPGGVVSGNVGVRVVRTKVTVLGHARLPDLTVGGPNVPQALKDKFHGQYIDTVGGRDYTNVLPSLNLKFKLADDWLLRLAASKAIARPSFGQLKGYAMLGASVDNDTGVVTNWQGTAGNPNLKPMIANQADASLEWYFGPTGHVYTTVFMKNIKNYISTGSFPVEYAGQDFTVTMPYNHGTGKVRGAQFSYSQFFHFLPGWLKGFGVRTNWTYVHSDGGVNAATSPLYPVVVEGVDLPMVGLSSHAFNFIVMYEHGPWSGRVAWNWRSQYLLSTSDAATHLPVWAGARGALDASLFYSINDNIQIGMRLNNLNNARTRVLMGPASYADGFVDHRLYTRGTFVTDKRAELLIRMKL